MSRVQQNNIDKAQQLEPLPHLSHAHAVDILTRNINAMNTASWIIKLRAKDMERLRDRLIASNPQHKHITAKTPSKFPLWKSQRQGHWRNQGE